MESGEDTRVVFIRVCDTCDNAVLQQNQEIAISKSDSLRCVLHGESSKRLASPRNTKDKKHLHKKKDKNRASRQTQAGIGPSAPAHRGGHVQNRSRRREQGRGRQRTRP